MGVDQNALVVSLGQWSLEMEFLSIALVVWACKSGHPITEVYTHG